MWAFRRCLILRRPIQAGGRAIPIVRTYGCSVCGHIEDVTLSYEQADDPPPPCSYCASATAQEFKPVALGGSIKVRAADLALTIAHEDYGVADIQIDHRRDSVPKVRYKDQSSPAQRSTWGAAGAMMEQAVALGRETRLKHGGSGLDILQANLRSGAQPDLIEISKKRAMRIW